MTKQNVTISLWERREIGREMADSSEPVYMIPEICHAHLAMS